MMNRSIAKAGSLIVIFSIFLFAICMLIPFDFGSYFVCMVLAVGYGRDSAVKATLSTGLRQKWVWHSQASTLHLLCWCISHKRQLSGLTR